LSSTYPPRHQSKQYYPRNTANCSADDGARTNSRSGLVVRRCVLLAGAEALLAAPAARKVVASAPAINAAAYAQSRAIAGCVGARATETVRGDLKARYGISDRSVGGGVVDGGNGRRARDDKSWAGKIVESRVVACYTTGGYEAQNKVWRFGDLILIDIDIPGETTGFV
jgi:hypothetical protein